MVKCKNCGKEIYQASDGDGDWYHTEINLRNKEYKRKEWCPYEVNHFEKNGICNLCGRP